MDCIAHHLWVLTRYYSTIISCQCWELLWQQMFPLVSDTCFISSPAHMMTIASTLWRLTLQRASINFFRWERMRLFTWWHGCLNVSVSRWSVQFVSILASSEILWKHRWSSPFAVQHSRREIEKISFLNVRIHRHDDVDLWTSVYRNATSISVQAASWWLDFNFLKWNCILFLPFNERQRKI